MSKPNLRAGYALFEDEYLTRQYINKVIAKVRPSYYVVTEGESTKSIETELSRCNPDFIISGIFLSDGESLPVYHKLGTTIPIVIFTQYSSYLPQLSSIQSITWSALKPISEKMLLEAIERVEEVLTG